MKTHHPKFGIFALSALMLGLAMSFSACGDDEPAKKPEDSPPPTSYGGGGGGTDPDPDPDTSFGKPRPGPIYDSANGPELPAAAGLDPQNPLVGAWKDAGKFYGDGYLFKADGTYEHYSVSSPQAISFYGWWIVRGRYQTSGNQIAFYNRICDLTDRRDSKESYRNEPWKDQTLNFAFVHDDSGKTKLKLTDPTKEDPYYATDIFSKTTEEDWMTFTRQVHE